MKILVLTGYDDKMQDVGYKSSLTHRRYAEKHGYSFEIFRKFNADSHPSWQKLGLVESRLSVFDSVLWLDADQFVTNFSIRVEDIQRDMKGLIFSADWSSAASSPFSAGAFISVNCPETSSIFLEAGKRTQWMRVPLWDQAAMQDVWRINKALKPFFHILPRRVLNAVPVEAQSCAFEPWQSGDFLCHLTGIENRKRLDIIKDMMQRGLFY